MDYASLRQEGIRQLERMAGGQWTDFNTHDPGITILEQLCYALTDLGYRAAYEVPDLLADGGADPYDSLHPPAEILTCRPVTPTDLRRLILDVEGVKNAWVEPLDQDTLPLYYHPDQGALTLSSDPPPSEPIELKGLYRVLIEATDPPPGDLQLNVVRRLHENRGLCEDFAAITVLSPQKIQVDATIEVGLVDDIGRLWGAVVQKIADVISPPLPFATLDDMLRAGKSVDEIFDGPQLARGFLTDEVLERATKRAAINTSDLIHAIMDISGVRTVRQLRVADDGKTWQDWSLKADPGQVAKLDLAGSQITLMREGKKVVVPAGAQAAPPAPAPAAGGSAPLARPVGRDRNVRTFWSVQHHLPALYGVGQGGLPGSAPPERKARAKQLKAYLMFFDQLMANYLEQLAHVKDLFSFEGAQAQTYFAQALAQPGLGLEALRDPAQDEYKTLLASLGQDPNSAATSPMDLERKSRFLNHLLARFAEALEDPGASQAEDLAARKQAFLRQYPRLGGARGTAFNYLAPATADSRSGLEDRIRLKLGLTPGEAFFVVEHILLRPTEGDENQQIPLLAKVLSKDPYSLQLTFVFKDGAGRFALDDFKELVEQTVRAETPAHLIPNATWMSGSDWTTFRTAYREWLDKRRAHVAQKLGVDLQELGA
jgi:hypothetical protein